MNQATLETISPVDQSIYATRPLATQDEITEAVNTAKQAQQLWRDVPLAKRREICEKAIEYFEQNRDVIAKEISWQMGRPIAFSGGEIGGVAERARHMINIAPSALKDVVPEEKSGFTRFIRREPLGVVLTVAPWNYPFLTTVNSVFPAILAGNAVLLKPSAQTPLSGEHFVKAFAQAGLPDGVLQCLFLSHQATSDLVASGDTDFVCFTGSVGAGKHIEKAAAGTFIGLGLELGGKDPAYVRADADLDYTVEQLVDGAFFNSGQSCCGIERIYVDESLFDEFVARFVELTKQYRLGDPLDENTNLGPVVKTNAADWVRKQITDAVAQGAKAWINEDDFSQSAKATPYLAPQVLTNVNHKMSVMTEESFGPVIGIMAVNSDQQALELMNDSDLGLTASIWSHDEQAALDLADKLETGTVFMNRCDYLDPALPWTGVKNTGRGETLSNLGFDQLTRAKSYHLKSIK